MLKSQFAVIAAAGVLLAGSAFAHAKLTHSSPAAGAQLTEAPTTLTLSFASAVKLASVAITGAGHMTPVTVDRSAKAAATLVIPLPALPPGRFELQWSAVSPDDGHVSKGSIAFTIAPAKH